VPVSGRLARSNVVITTDIGVRGDAIVTWHDNGRSGSAYAAIARPGKPFGPVQTLGPTGFGMHVAIAPDGAAILAQSVLEDSASSSFELRVMQLAAGADSFGAPVRLDDSCDCGEAAENFDLALAPNGRVAVVWGNGTSTRSGLDVEYHNVLDVFEGTL